MCLVEYLVIPIICDRIFNTQFFYFFRLYWCYVVDSCVYEINFYKCTRASTCVCSYVCRKKEEKTEMFVTGNIKYSYQIRNWKRHKNIRNILFFLESYVYQWRQKEKPYKVAILLCVLFLIFLFHRSLFFMSMLVYGGTHKKRNFLSLSFSWHYRV